MSAEYPLAIPTMIVPGTKLDSPAHSTIETKQNEEIVAIAGELDTHKNKTLDPHGAMSLTNNLLFSSGKGLGINEGSSGKAISVEGTDVLADSGAQTVASSARNITTQKITIECWYKRSSIGYFADKRAMVGRGYGDYCMLLYYGSIAFTFDMWGASAWKVWTGSTPVAGVWTHLAVTYEESTQKVNAYMNGVKLPEGTLSAGTTFPNISTNKICIGCNGDTGWGAVGCYDEIRISDNIRYTTDFTPSTTKLVSDANTIALFHADEGSAMTLVDEAGKGNATAFGTQITWVDGAVSGGNIDKTIVKRTSGSPETGAGVVVLGHPGDKLTIPLTATGFVKSTAGVSSIDTATYLDIDQVTTPQTVTGNVVITGEMKSGTAKIGDVANGNYTEIESDGSIHLIGDSTVWDDYMIPGTSVRQGATAPDFVPGFNEDSQIYYSAFAGTGQAEYVFFNLQMPHNWKLGTTIYPHVHICPTSTNAGDTNQRVIRFALEYMWANIDGLFPARATIYLDSGPFVPNTSQWKHILCKNGTGIDGTGKGLSSMLMCKLVRYGEDSANIDTYPQDVAFLQFDIHYEIDTLGSREEYLK